MPDKEQELYTQLDTLAANLSSSSLQFGWVAIELWHMKQEEFMEHAGGNDRKALTLFITHIQERESKDTEARKTISDRIRIGKYISHEAYDQIVAASGGVEPTYHQIRAVIFTDKGDVDETKTNAMIDWCVARGWPSVADIRIQRDVIVPKVAVDPAAKHFKLFVKMAQTIMADTVEGSPRFNVAKAVLELWKNEQPVKL
jgi:hypothetical protein